MPIVTLTTRSIKNKDSGLDISIPREVNLSSFLTRAVVYEVVVVTNLPQFKNSHHKPKDIIQFSVRKKLEDFETLRDGFIEKYKGSVLPPLPKKNILLKDSSENKQKLEKFLNSVTTKSSFIKSVCFMSFLGFDMDQNLYSKEKFKEKKPTTQEIFGGNEDSGGLFDDDLKMTLKQQKDTFNYTDTYSPSLELGKEVSLFEKQDLGQIQPSFDTTDYNAEDEDISLFSKNCRGVKNQLHEPSQLQDDDLFVLSSKLDVNLSMKSPEVKKITAEVSDKKVEHNVVPVDSLTNNDILNYIQSHEVDEDLDLFS